MTPPRAVPPCAAPTTCCARALHACQSRCCTHCDAPRLTRYAVAFTRGFKHRAVGHAAARTTRVGDVLPLSSPRAASATCCARHSVSRAATMPRATRCAPRLSSRCCTRQVRRARLSVTLLSGPATCCTPHTVSHSAAPLPRAAHHLLHPSHAPRAPLVSHAAPPRDVPATCVGDMFHAQHAPHFQLHSSRVSRATLSATLLPPPRVACATCCPAMCCSHRHTSVTQCLSVTLLHTQPSGTEKRGPCRT